MDLRFGPWRWALKLVAFRACASPESVVESRGLMANRRAECVQSLCCQKLQQHQELEDSNHVEDYCEDKRVFSGVYERIRETGGKTGVLLGPRNIRRSLEAAALGAEA